MKVAASLFVAVAFVAANATAAPSLWDEVRDPDAVKVHQALVAAHLAREPKDIPPEALAALPAFERSLAMQAVTVLELAGGESLGTPEVWYYLGDALVTSDHGRDEDGRRILLRALARDPTSPEAASAWFHVAIASDRLRDFAAERDAYTEALRVEWDARARSDIYANRGEASMSLGDLRAAREDYLIALATTNDSEAHALAAWGLAVALARDDDLPEALRYVWEASSMQFADIRGQPIAAIELPSVFFTPDYEIFYYRALADMAASEHTEDPKEQKKALDAAVFHWSVYLAEARAHGDRWIANAEHQLKWCERRMGLMVSRLRR